jgi:predicted metal-dependent hydrolase
VIPALFRFVPNSADIAAENFVQRLRDWHMIARNPKLTFDPSVSAIAPQHAFVHSLNAASSHLPYLEPYLNKIMALVAAKTNSEALKKDISSFMAQEGNHYRQHKIFNRALIDRYPELTRFESEIAQDFNRMSSKWSLTANTAYCEGFESLGIIHAVFFFEEMDDLLVGVDPGIISLWKWHLGEEFEHRTVCFDAHFAPGGGYWQRIWGLLYAMRHLGAYGKRVTAYMLSVDRVEMSPPDLARSISAEKAYNRRLKRYTLPRILRLFSPFYDPRRKSMPRGAVDVLARVESGTISG